MGNLTALILAAGEGKRMKSKHSKMVHKIWGKQIISWICDTAEEVGFTETIIVVGHNSREVKGCLGEKYKYVLQKEQLGTGHAAIQAKDLLEGKEGLVFILCGDTPLISSETIKSAIEYHLNNRYGATIITAFLEDPEGYGRIVRDTTGNVIKIVEHRDASPKELEIKEINSGMYCFKIRDLLLALEELDNNNDQGEYYITDTIRILLGKGLGVGAFKTENPAEIMGINDRVQLYQASEIIREKILRFHMENGVTIINADSTFIDKEVKIGMDTIISPGTIIEGSTKIGENCTIGPNSRIISSTVGNCTEIAESTITESMIGDNVFIGPFAHIRPGSCIGNNVKVGSFVEVKKSIIGDRTKIPHLSYVGDTTIGKNANIGCGVITVNYDGKSKNRTDIGDNAFIGCNTNLIAPVKVGENSYIAAGSTITSDIPEYSLAIARERQIIKENWVKKRGMIRENHSKKGKHSEK